MISHSLLLKIQTDGVTKIVIMKERKREREKNKTYTGKQKDTHTSTHLPSPITHMLIK